MDKKKQCAPGTPDENVYRKRRNSYSEAMTEENTIDDQLMERRNSRASLATNSSIRRKAKYRENSSFESETWSSMSFDSKRELNRTPSGDTSRSWSEVEIPEVLRSYPDIVSRLTRCRCYPASSIANKCQCRYRFQCSCNQCCNRQRRRISAISRRDSFGSFKRKDSNYSVSTCQSFLPPSSGRNSTASLYRVSYCNRDSADRPDQPERIIGKNSIQRRHSDQTHFVRGCQIEYVDRRRYSEQTPRDNIGVCASARCNGSNHSRTRLPSKFLAKAGQRRSWLSFQRDSSDDVVLAVREADNETDNEKDGNDSGISSVTENRRKSTAVTPNMLRRRFSEQLILEAGLAGLPDFESLVAEQDEIGGEEEEESFTGINARKRLTLKKHYYPEGGWGRTIVLVAVLVQLLSHGLQLAAGVILTPTIAHFPEHDVRDAGRTKSKIYSAF
ncbi:hypothetical protein KPH14_010892 [Odynerus spinipes]|uniref:Uncharacterized protein n=1 Tax=Odynerus spinipes TaxID=1348599 RepID=A0AAD9RH92_9HYME|nr:hypothetical protein KPH14_010892 [Odynerus spinipes]